LTASELTDLNRLAEDAYRSTGSTDEALLSLVKGFYQVARANYPPLIIPTATAQPSQCPKVTRDRRNVLLFVYCGVVVMFILWVFIRLARSGINIDFPIRVPHGTAGRLEPPVRRWRRLGRRLGGGSSGGGVSAAAAEAVVPEEVIDH
jgi:hypothetical protein